MYLVPALDKTLLALAHLLREHDEPLWADSCERLAADAADAATAGERSDVARAALRLYQSGMGRFHDVVFQDDDNVAPDQDRLDSLRSEPFEHARGRVIGRSWPTRLVTFPSSDLATAAAGSLWGCGHTLSARASTLPIWSRTIPG